MEKPSVAMIIVAGGKGTRMGQKQNKVFLPLGDTTVLGETLSVWQKIPLVQNIVVVCGAQEHHLVEEICRQQQIAKVSQIVTGGKERQDSVWQGLLALAEETPLPAYVGIHDGARPFYDGAAFAGFYETVVRSAAVGGVLAVPIQDTVKQVEQGQIVKTLDRSSLVAVQTPQLFAFAPLFACYQKSIGQGKLFTDDAGMLEAAGETVLVYPGQKENMKLTTPEDFTYAQFLWAKKKNKRSGEHADRYGI